MTSNSIIDNCTIENTVVRATSINADGERVVGHSLLSLISNCHNLGFSNDPNKIIVQGQVFIGGIVGIISFTSIIKCGVLRRTIAATA